MTRTLRITLSEEREAELQRAREQLQVAGKPLSDVELLSEVLTAGVRAIAIAHADVADGDDRPLGSLTVRELAQMMGVPDLAATRANNVKAREASVESMNQALLRLKDVRGLAVVTTPIRMTTAKEVTDFANDTAEMLAKQGPGATLLIVAAWAQSDGTTEPLVTNRIVN